MAGSHFGIAKIYVHQGKYEQALGEIDAALHLAPDSQGTHNLRGQILSKLGRKAEARTSYERALALARQEPERRFLTQRLAELRD